MKFGNYIFPKTFGSSISNFKADLIWRVYSCNWTSEHGFISLKRFPEWTICIMQISKYIFILAVVFPRYFNFFWASGYLYINTHNAKTNELATDWTHMYHLDINNFHVQNDAPHVTDIAFLDFYSSTKPVKRLQNVNSHFWVTKSQSCRDM